MRLIGTDFLKTVATTDLLLTLQVHGVFAG